MASASTSSYGLGARDNRSAMVSNMDIGSVISSDGGGSGGGSGRSMHQAPSLAEAPPGSGPRPDEPRSSQYSMHGANTGIRSPSPGPVGDDDGGELGPDQAREPLPIRRTQSVSPPRQMETYSSASAAGENMRQSRAPSVETTSNGYSLSGLSPTNHASQGVFPINGSDNSQNRRANRRRTGPLSADQRERAAIIRKLGACPDCRRRRVAVSMISLYEQLSLGGMDSRRPPPPVLLGAGCSALYQVPENVGPRLEHGLSRGCRLSCLDPASVLGQALLCPGLLAPAVMAYVASESVLGSRR